MINFGYKNNILLINIIIVIMRLHIIAHLEQ